MTKPLPAHKPWSGGSNSWPKFVTALSRLETPLKFAISGEAPRTGEDAARGAAAAGAPVRRERGIGRAPWLRPVDAPVAAVGWTWASVGGPATAHAAPA